MLEFWTGRRRPAAVRLPYDATHPVVYDKDDYLNGYTGEYLIALASAGAIDLRCIVAGSLWPGADPDEIVGGHAGYVEICRASGMRNLPEVLPGPFRSLQRPATDRIEDTEPIETPGVRRILVEARRADPTRPLVVVTGGSLTAPASALLLDPDCGERMIVAAACGRYEDLGDYNGFMDGWAAYVVLRRTRYVQFPAGISPARVPKARFRSLPDSPLREWLIRKEAPYSGLPAGIDVDGAPAISLMRQDYVESTRPAEFAHWRSRATSAIPGRESVEYPLLRFTDDGPLTVVTRARAGVATVEFWRAIRDPAAW